MKKAVIIGCFCQDGQLLYDLLTRRGYHVIGVGRGKTIDPKKKIIKAVDISNAKDVDLLIRKIQPNEVYYLAAFHHSSQENIANEQADIFQRTFDVSVISLVNVLESIREFSPKTKLFYASSSLIFGKPEKSIQDETTPFHPESVYAIAKVAGMMACAYYRKAHSVFAACGILYNHESHLRQKKFVSKKIVQGALAIKEGRSQQLLLGTLDAEVDWGYAPDYVEAMHRILQLKKADDFVIATGKRHSVRQFVEITFKWLGLNWKKYVVIKPGIIKRQNYKIVGNPKKLMKAARWKPTVDFKTMIRLLLEHEGALIHGA